MAESISSNGYVPPKTIPYFTSNGIPFGYSPLGFYLLAIGVDVSGLSYRYASFALRLLWFTLSPLAIYLFVRQLSTRRAAALASVLVTISLPVFRWHLGHGGVIRGLAFCLSFVTLALALKSFQTESAKLQIGAGVAFGLTVLTHPVYAVFAGFGTVGLWVGSDRSIDGFRCGGNIATIGFLISAPWILWVTFTHGVDIFLYASGTHGGLFEVHHHLYAVISLPTHGLIEKLLWYLGILCLGILFYEYRFHVVALFVATAVFLGGTIRFTFSLLLISIAIVVIDFLPNWVSQIDIDQLSLRRRSAAIVSVGLVFAAAFAGVGAAQSLPHDSFSDADRDAAKWAKTETASDATFIVQGAEEEFPFFAKRTSLVVPWGAEWDGPGAYQHHLEMLESVYSCSNTTCFSKLTAENDLDPDYLYLQRHLVTESSFSESEKYTAEYQNEQILIVSVKSRES
ncbi:ArnT family glycosyltransferase [Haloarcula pellucida]|uniref:ArnT family glycosyltransferase n=1 Tax=Haloarcula pellucida TaxID=1427151 RepID=UPI00166E25CA|nr:glycosyltransferase family 39 protein [Halomicroarcula pellucida]MBX0347226.1 glycosyltransferase family 39 protein [Halomicroarcula pellucida]